MIIIIALAFSLIFLGGFILLTLYEVRSGKRIMAPIRARFDARLGEMAKVARKLNKGGLGDRLRIIGAYLVHEFVHEILLIVRALERLLTQIVRALRENRVTKSSAVKEHDKTEKVG